MNTVYMYGIGGASDGFRVIRYAAIPQEEMSVMTLKYEMNGMLFRYPSIKRVFVIDQRPGLARMVTNSFKKNSIEENLILVDFLERNAIELNG